MSGVNSLTFSYQEYKSYVKNNRESRLANRSYSMEPGRGKSEGRLLGSVVYKDTRTGGSYEMEAAYDDHFTSDVPLIKVMVSGAGEKKQEYSINIDEIDVNAASDIEMFALCSYADAHNKKTGSAAGSTAGSWNFLRAYVNDRLSESYPDQSGINPLEQKRDWLAMVGEERESCMEAKLYQQVTDGNRLTHMLEKYGMPKEVEMMRIGANTLVPVENGIRVLDVDAGYAQILFDGSGEIRYVNHLNEKAGWSMEVSQEMMEKAEELGSEFALFMGDKGFWESYLNGSMDIDQLRAAVDYKTVQTDFFDSLPASVRKVWDEAAAEAGTDGTGIGENGELQYPSEFMKQYISALLKGERARICNGTVESVLEFAQNALARLNDDKQPAYNENMQKLKDREFVFYQSLIGRLEHLGEN